MNAAFEPKVTVGMPIYNGEPFIEMAILSILQQNYNNIEIIISDNCSTDKTQEICERYASADDRIRYIRLDENQGVVYNFQNVARHATGKYFMWATADDVHHPDFIPKLVQVLEKRDDVVLAFSWVQRINEEGYLTGLPMKGLYTISSKNTLKRMKQNLLIVSGTMVYGMVRSDILQKTIIFPDEEIGTNSDAGILTELSAYGRFYIINETLFYRRKHKKQLNNTRNDSYWNQSRWFLNQETIDWVRSFPILENEKNELIQFWDHVIKIRKNPKKYQKILNRYVRKIKSILMRAKIIQVDSKISNVQELFQPFAHINKQEIEVVEW